MPSTTATKSTVSTEESAKTVSKDSVLQDIRESLAKRFMDMQKVFNESTSIATRYDLKIAMEELKFIYENLLK